METILNHAGGLATGDPQVMGAACEHHHHEYEVTIKPLPAGHEAKFRLPGNAALLEVLEEGAKHLHLKLLPPPPAKPLDQLHDIAKHDHVGPAITDLDQS